MHSAFGSLRFPNKQGCVAFLPYPLIRKRRLQLGWGATNLAQVLKVSTDTVYNWEHNRSSPAIRFMPGITLFLGYALAS